MALKMLYFVLSSSFQFCFIASKDGVGNMPLPDVKLYINCVKTLNGFLLNKFRIYSKLLSMNWKSPAPRYN